MPERSKTLRESEEDPLLSTAGKQRWTFWSVWNRLRLPLVILGIFVWIYVGYVHARDHEGWSALTAIYVIVQIVTTVGYGDITVTTEEGKFFMAFYVIITVLILGALVTDCVDKLLANNAETLRKHIQKVQKIKNNNGKVDYCGLFVDWLKHFEHLVVSFILFAIFVAAGTIFYATYEKCTCSYGVTHVKDCIDGVDTVCAATGGYTKTWIDAFYMSVITLTTVGFGDHAPRSDTGRAVGCVWMLFGVVATANFASAFGALLIGAQKNDHRLGKVTEEIFQKIDKDKDGSIDRREFRTYALLKFGLVTYEDLDEIDNLFDAMDTDGNGTLSHDEVFAYCDAE
jgi:potassium channel subfamily K